MLKAITFDCWDTLIADDASRDRERKTYIRGILEENGKAMSINEVAVLFKREARFFENHIIQHRKTQNARERAETIMKLAEVDLQPSEIIKIGEYCDMIALEYRPPVVPNVKEVLGDLSKRFGLGLICNTGWHSNGTVRTLLEENGLTKYFEWLSFSDEVGVAKPHIQIFEITVGKLGFRLEEAAHIGDSEYSDIVGAKEANMMAILFTGVNKKYEDNNSADFVFDKYENLLALLEEAKWRTSKS